MIKDIIKNLKPSSTLLINEKSNKLESEGKKIFKFGFGQSPFKVPQELVDQFFLFHEKLFYIFFVILFCQCNNSVSQIL